MRTTTKTKARSPKTAAKKRNPDAVTTFAHLASGVLSALQVSELMNRKSKSKRRPTRRSKTPARTRVNPAAAPKIANRKSQIANPRPRVKVPAKGNYYLLTIGGRNGDIAAVYIQDGDGDGKVIAKKFKTVPAAKAYATRNRLALKNPADPKKITAAVGKKIDMAINPKSVVSSRKSVAKKANPKSPNRKSKIANPKVSVARTSVRATQPKKPVTKKTNPTKKASVVRRPSSVAKKTNPSKIWQVTAKAGRRIGCQRPGCNKSARWGYRDGVSTFYKCGEHKPKVAKKANPKSPNRKSQIANPPVPRRRTFEMFNGRQAANSKVVKASKLILNGRKRTANVDQLGRLVEIHMESGEVLKFNPRDFSLDARNGRLWITGGPIHDGPMPLKLNPLGKIENIVYQTWKPHHGDPKGQHYIHEMGEWSGNRPTLAIDNEGFAVIRGGSYKIEARGIVD